LLTVETTVSIVAKIGTALSLNASPRACPPRRLNAKMCYLPLNQLELLLTDPAPVSTTLRHLPSVLTSIKNTTVILVWLAKTSNAVVLTKSTLKITVTPLLTVMDTRGPLTGGKGMGALKPLLTKEKSKKELAGSLNRTTR